MFSVRTALVTAIAFKGIAISHVETQATVGKTQIESKANRVSGVWKMRRIGILLLATLTVSCRKGLDAPPVETAEHERHTESVTNWTAKTELFMEYPPLVAGRTSRFAIHLTRLDFPWSFAGAFKAFE